MTLLLQILQFNAVEFDMKCIDSRDSKHLIDVWSILIERSLQFWQMYMMHLVTMLDLRTQSNITQYMVNLILINNLTISLK